MSKAFDSIEHNLFLYKLSAYRILNKEHCRYFTNNLSDWMQTVSVNGACTVRVWKAKHTENF